ncbi:hypothetical protein G5714_016952 [Onychostoma macrolepis]|uniref:Uncharacterized protein n=1 Tax=Onychostoma macrolepis TaxID=369639 RepID=A0A7J6C8N9_9TELE|nr:hypothetical protein G5714_016952 [Onychostoma macrolepis]
MYSLNALYGEAYLRSVGVTASEQHVQQESVKDFSAELVSFLWILELASNSGPSSSGIEGHHRRLPTEMPWSCSICSESTKYKEAISAGLEGKRALVNTT